MPKAKVVKKARRKSSSRNCIPALAHSEIVAEQNRPLAFEAVPVMADKVVQLWADIDEWRTACRKAFADGKTVKDLPTFSSSKLPNPNAGRLSRTAHEKLIDEYNDALDAGRRLPGLPPRYCPVEMELIHAIGCTVIRKGQANKPPRNWQDKYGSWFHIDDDGERTIPSGWILDSKRQRGCHKAVDKMIENSPDNVVTIGQVRYVIAAGQKASQAALYQIDCSERGNYGAVWDVRRRLCMAKARGIINLVWRIEDMPLHGGSCIKIDMVGNGSFNFFMPGQSATPGYLTSNGKEMTPAQVRKAVTDDAKGIKFKALKEPIVGEWVSMDEAWPQIKQAFKASKRSNTETNANVQCRVSHDEGYPFGFRGASVAIVPCFRWVYDGNKYSLEMNLVVGCRVNQEYNVTRQEARATYHEAHAKDEPAPATAPKAEKPKKKAKKAKKVTKAEKPKKTKVQKVTTKAEPVVDESAAPIDVDTASDADVYENVDETQHQQDDAQATAIEDES